MKIIVGGAISRYPCIPGQAWNWIHRIVGLQRLGHDVLFVEEVFPASCVDPAGRPCSFEHSVGRDLFQATMMRFGLGNHASQIYNGGEATCGLPFQEVADFCRTADVILNMSGHVTTESILGRVKHRAYVDEDPVYTQLWHAEYEADLNFAAHNAFFSVGLNIGTARSPVPDCGIRWHHFLPPVVLDYWPVDINPACRAFTTVASLSAYPDLHYRGERYGSKRDEFARFADLPGRVNQEFELVLRAEESELDDLRVLKAKGWAIRDGVRVSSLRSYRDYVCQSRAEIGIAKHAYVHGRSGWFSDRSSHYLACGKPVLAQSTDFEHRIPTGEGLLTFRTLDEAVAAVEAINSNYEDHCRAARRLAEQHLDYRNVLPAMLEMCSS